MFRKGKVFNEDKVRRILCSFMSIELGWAVLYGILAMYGIFTNMPLDNINDWFFKVLFMLLCAFVMRIHIKELDNKKQVSGKQTKLLRNIYLFLMVIMVNMLMVVLLDMCFEEFGAIHVMMLLDRVSLLSTVVAFTYIHNIRYKYYS